MCEVQLLSSTYHSTHTYGPGEVPAEFIMKDGNPQQKKNQSVWQRSVTSQYWTREPKETIIRAIFPNHVEKTRIPNQPMKPKRNTNTNHPK